MRQLHEAQDPPYSEGILSVTIHLKLSARKWSNYIMQRISEPGLTSMARLDYFYVDNDFAKYSLKKLNGYETFSETLRRKSPGYKLDPQTLFIVPDTDHRVNLDEFFALMRSKDIKAYEKNKDKFFGPSGRFTTENAIEQMSVLYATFPRSGNSMMRKYFENVCGLATGSDL